MPLPTALIICAALLSTPGAVWLALHGMRGFIADCYDNLGMVLYEELRDDLYRELRAALRDELDTQLQQRLRTLEELRAADTAKEAGDARG